MVFRDYNSSIVSAKVLSNPFELLLNDKDHSGSSYNYVTKVVFALSKFQKTGGA